MSPRAVVLSNRWCRVPGCARTKPLPASQNGRQCSACLTAKRERRPRLYLGPCVCGCGATAGGRSGMARGCYLRMLRRRKMFKRVMKDLVGIPLPADHLALALRSILPPVASLEMRRALKALVGLLDALHAGRVMVNRYTLRPPSSYRPPVRAAREA